MAGEEQRPGPLSRLGLARGRKEGKEGKEGGLNRARAPLRDGVRRTGPGARTARISCDVAESGSLRPCKLLQRDQPGGVGAGERASSIFFYFHGWDFRVGLMVVDGGERMSVVCSVRLAVLIRFNFTPLFFTALSQKARKVC